MNRDFETGVMLDIGRKYYSPEQIKRLICELAALKCNSLMIHFSEDMGLGLECPAYPWLAGRAFDLCPAREALGEDRVTSVITLSELREIIDFAGKCGIEIIPSYDSPGHTNFTVRRFNDYVKENGSFTFVEDGNEYTASYDGEYFRFYKNGENLGYSPETSGKYGIFSYYLLDGRHSIVKGTGNESCARGIDICNELAVAFIHSVLGSYAKFFFECGCRKIDIGGDEMLGFCPAIAPLTETPRWHQLEHWKQAAIKATGKPGAVAYDCMVLYMNGLIRLVKSLGYESVRLWNDEFRRTFDTGWNTDPSEHVQFEGDVTVQYWSGKTEYESLASLADNGYSLINCDSTYCYYVLLEKARKQNPEIYTKVNPESIISDWSPYGVGKLVDGRHQDGWYLDTEERKKALHGAYFCVWSDNPTIRSDSEAIDELLPLLKAWKSKI